jgi:transcriptional regulator with XRE-family HTH domain
MGDIQRDFGARIRHLRQEKGLTQEALAGKAGLHTTYISGVERAEYNVSLENIARLAKALGVATPDLFEGDKAPARQTEADRLRVSIIRILTRQTAPKLRTILNVVKEIAAGR